MEVAAEKHTGRDVRKESFRPDSTTIRMVGEPLGTDSGYWTTRAKHVLAKKSASMEELLEMQKRDQTSLGVFKPKEIVDLLIKSDAEEWKSSFIAALKQNRLGDERKATKEPPQKVPWRFQYKFRCEGPKCKGHQMMIEDWEVGALYWNAIDDGAKPDEAAATVKQKFFHEICGPSRDTHFFVGTVLEFGTWVVVGTFWPKKKAQTELF